MRVEKGCKKRRCVVENDCKYRRSASREGVQVEKECE